MVPDRFAPVLDELAPLADRFRRAGHQLYLVGGSVRDLLLGSTPRVFDLDLTTDAHPDQIKDCLKGWADAIWTQGERFGTIGAQRAGAPGTSPRVYEITTFRSEAYTDDSRKPHVSFGDRIEDDLARRDFTVNAMALDVIEGPSLVDPFGGAADLVARVLRTPLGAEISFSDDPLRMLRAARFIAGYGLEPEASLIEAVKTMAPRLSIVSPERIRDELDKLITVDHPTAGLWFLVETGLAEQFLPELPALRLEHDPIHRHKDVLTHTMAVIENIEAPQDDPETGAPPFDFRVTRLAALFHDIGKPRTRGFDADKGTTFHHHDVVGARMTRRRLTELRYSNSDIDAITELVALHLRFHTYRLGWTDSAVRRYVRDAGPLLAELNVLTRCDCTTRNERKARVLARRMDELEERIGQLALAEELAAIRPELNGREVMEQLGVEPGPVVGEALDMLLEIRLEEGLIGTDEARRRLDAWYAGRAAAP